MCTVLPLEQLFKLFLLTFFFLEILLTIYSSNDLAQDILVLFWSQLLVTHSTLDVQAMVNWWSSQEILFPLTLLFLAHNTSLHIFFFFFFFFDSSCSQSLLGVFKPKVDAMTCHNEYCSYYTSSLTKNRKYRPFHGKAHFCDISNPKALE